MAEEDKTMNQFCRLGMYKAMGPAGLHLVLLREQASVTVGMLSVLFKELWRSVT